MKVRAFGCRHGRADSWCGSCANAPPAALHSEPGIRVIFYPDVFTFIVQTILIGMPIAWAMRDGSHFAGSSTAQVRTSALAARRPITDLVITEADILRTDVW
jgi:hypothetical protein